AIARGLAELMIEGKALPWSRPTRSNAHPVPGTRLDPQHEAIYLSCDFLPEDIAITNDPRVTRCGRGEAGETMRSYLDRAAAVDRTSPGKIVDAGMVDFLELEIALDGISLLHVNVDHFAVRSGPSTAGGWLKRCTFTV